MNPELDILMTLSRVLGDVGNGRGVAGALVRSFGSSRGQSADVARLTLLGHPPEVAMGGLLLGHGPEVAMLSGLIVNGARGNSILVGKKGEELAKSLESWINTREGRKLEQRVLAFRGLLVSAVLGAVLGMISSVGPLLGGLNFMVPSPQMDPSTLTAASAVMGCVSSAMLGLFVSRRGLWQNLVATMGVFLIVITAVRPLMILGQ
jgi:hypothetical protein